MDTIQKYQFFGYKISYFLKINIVLLNNVICQIQICVLGILKKMEDLCQEQSVLKLTTRFVMFNPDDGGKPGAGLMLQKLTGDQNVSNVQVNIEV